MNIEITPELITIILSSLCMGAILGVLLSRILSNPAKHKRHISEELRQNLQNSATYQHEVTEHFVKASQLIKNMADCHNELHHHMADSATKLASANTETKLAETSEVQLELVLPKPPVSGQPQAPRDYAPGNGVLREDYGFAQGVSANDEDSADKPFNDSVNDTTFDKDLEGTENDPSVKVG